MVVENTRNLTSSVVTLGGPFLKYQNSSLPQYLSTLSSIAFLAWFLVSVEHLARVGKNHSGTQAYRLTGIS